MEQSEKLITRYCLYFGDEMCMSYVKTYATFAEAEKAKTDLKSPAVRIAKVELSLVAEA
jgi:hypothetical protein